MNVNHSKNYKRFLNLLIISILIGYYSPSTVSANIDNKREHRLDDYLNEHHEDIAGLAAIVMDRDQMTYKMRGYADIEKQILVNEDTVFEWASVSKILIWISVMQLVEKGKLDLEIDIHNYLPSDFRSKSKIGDPITMQHLMQHTAGFDDSYTDLMLPRPTLKPSLKEALEEADIKHVFPPGDIVAYSNYGSGLAAYIVEEVSGLDYGEYVRKNIFEPLQMTKTSIDPYQEDNKWVGEQRSQIQGYSTTLEIIEPNIYSFPIYPIGSVMGTATDLQKLLQELLSEDGSALFDDKSTLDMMFEPTLYYPETTIPRVANGFFYLPSKSHHVYGHGGNSKAFSSSFYVDRKEGIGVIVLTNVKDETTFTSGIPEIVFGKYVPAVHDENLEDSSDWEGIYEPARLPNHGFSKVYGLTLRGKTIQDGNTNLIMNGFHYSQVRPGIYKTEAGPSLYSLDVYSKHPQMKKIISNTYSDLLYVSTYKHVLEWGAIFLGLFAFLFSFFYCIVTFTRMIWKRDQLHLLLVGQHVLNLLLCMNVIWIGYKTFSLVSYSFLKPYLTLNLLYLVITFINSVVLSARMKKLHLSKLEKRNWAVSIVFTIILCVNILYWEFYF